jgi:hypothetical protein
MRSTRTLTLVGVFTSVIVASDWALSPLFNVKLLDTLVFASSYSLGFRTGAAIAILSELIWGIFNPLGPGYLIVIFTISGELLYAAAGALASRMWSVGEVKSLSPTNLYFGAAVAICAFLFDVETNLATGLLVGARTPLEYLGYLALGIPFAVPHEVSDFVFGSLLAPLVILYLKRYSPGKEAEREQPPQVLTGSGVQNQAQAFDRNVVG